MLYHYEATSDFFNSVLEVEELLRLSFLDEKNSVLFLKLASVSLITKFQVFVENILGEFHYKLNGIKSDKISLYMKMNALRISVNDGNALISLPKGKKFTEDNKNRIVSYINSISFIIDDNVLIDNDFPFNTKYPLGKTGKKELIDLLMQIDGDTAIFDQFGNDEFNKLDSILQTRHLIIHQDRFFGTNETVKENISFIKKLVEYIDNYLFEKFPDKDN